MNRRALTLWPLALALAGASRAADHVGDGVEPDPIAGATSSIPPAREGALQPAPDPLPRPASPLAPRPGEAATTPQPAGAGPGVDLIADRPGAAAAKARDPFYVELEDFPPTGNPNPRAEKAYAAIAELKKLVSLISADLDAGGRERTRLIRSAEGVSAQATALAELWPTEVQFRDACASAKRSALVLEEELRGEPRRWTHVRWAFQETQRQVRDLRRSAAALAATEPALVRVVRKGQEVWEAPPKDPATVKREEEERRKRELREEKERLRKREQETKDSSEDARH